ncbi:transposase [Nostoc sp. CHAB 5824]|nr:transposase [Nostoc sp. CHAB 5824]
MLDLDNYFKILEQTCLKRGMYFQKVDSRKTSQICPNCQTETDKKKLLERIHVCLNYSYTTDRDVAGAQIVFLRGLAATVKMLGVSISEAYLGLSIGSPKT